VLPITSSAALDAVDVISRGSNLPAKYPKGMRGDSVQESSTGEPSVATAIIDLLKRAQDVIATDAQTAAACVERAFSLIPADQDPTTNARGPVFGTLGVRVLGSLQVRAVTAHIEANLGQPVRVADIAQVARLSPSWFTRAFRASFGRSPHNYITQRRLACAMEMMLSTRVPLCQIAVACGFCDQAHFSRHFQHRFGMTPRVVRHQLRAQEDRDHDGLLR
jgi:AraC family transcriptional regulator